MTDENMNIQTPPLNQVLKDAREDLSLSLEAISNQLNLPIEKLEYMESDGFDPKVLGPFERGYVRSYASLLGLDKSVCDTYLPDISEVSSELRSMKRFNYGPQKPSKVFRFIKVFFWLAVFLVVVWLAWSGLKSKQESGGPLLPPPIQSTVPLKNAE